MSADWSPPAERDLPRPAYERIRAAVIDAASQRSTPRPRWFAPSIAVATAAAVTAVTVGVVTTTTRHRGPDPSVASPSGERPTWNVPHPTLPPGVTAEEASRIVAECGGRKAEEERTNKPWPPGYELQLYNVHRTPAGTFAWVFSAKASIKCKKDHRATAAEGGNPARFDVFASSGGDYRRPLPLPDHLSIEMAGHHPPAGYATVVGRVSPRVAAVEVKTSGRAVRVATVNGTYAVWITDALPGADTTVVVTGYDANGKVVSTVSQGGPRSATPKAPAPPPPAGWKKPVPGPVAGLSATRSNQLTTQCNTNPSPTSDLEPGDPFNAVTNAGVVHLYVIGETGARVCDIKGTSHSSSEGRDLAIPWVINQVSMDVMGGSPGSRYVAGRVGADVTKVRVEAGTRSVEVPVVNGTYLAVIDGLSTQANVTRLVALDAAGREIGGWGGNPQRCGRTPDGKVFVERYRGQTPAPDTCQPAVPWS